MFFRTLACRIITNSSSSRVQTHNEDAARILNACRSCPPAAAVVANLGDVIPVLAAGGTTTTIDTIGLWSAARLLRQSAASRQRLGAVIVGGSRHIVRLWKEFGMRPSVVFVPDDGAGGMVLPRWCVDAGTSAGGCMPFVVRCSAHQIRDVLLSTSPTNDPVAAQFDMPLPRSVAPEVQLGLELPHEPTPPARDDAEGAAAVPGVTKADGGSLFQRIAVLHRVHIPGNVGQMILSASHNGFRTVILDTCCDAFGEKVIRASHGEVFNPALNIVQFNRDIAQVGARGGAAAPAGGASALIQRVAIAHHLLPIVTVANQEAEPIFSVAQRFHYINARSAAARQNDRNRAASSNQGGSSRGSLGAMVMAGAEGTGVAQLLAEWNHAALPVKLATIPMENSSEVANLNVAAAMSVALHHFRPAAASEFDELVKEGIVPQSVFVTASGKQTPLVDMQPSVAEMGAAVERLAQLIDGGGDTTPPISQGAPPAAAAMPDDPDSGRGERTSSKRPAKKANKSPKAKGKTKVPVKRTGLRHVKQPAAAARRKR